MDEILKAVADILRENGLFGLIIVGLGYAWYKLAFLYHEAQQSRINDGRDAIKALDNNTNSLNKLIDLLENRKRKDENA